MLIHTKRDTYKCASAEQYLDGVHLLNEDGSIYVILTQPDMIQSVEDGEIVVVEQPRPIAPYNILAGKYVTIDNVLYKATENIPNGEPIIVGQNAIETTVEDQLYELTKGE